MYLYMYNNRIFYAHIILSYACIACLAQLLYAKTRRVNIDSFRFTENTVPTKLHNILSSEMF